MRSLEKAREMSPLCPRLSLSCSSVHPDERERLTFPTRATLAERRDDRHRVVAHAQQIKLGQPDAAETSHGRAEQPAVRVEEELPERVPVRVESAVDQERLERGRVDGRRQVG